MKVPNIYVKACEPTSGSGFLVNTSLRAARSTWRSNKEKVNPNIEDKRYKHVKMKSDLM